MEIFGYRFFRSSDPNGENSSIPEARKESTFWNLIVSTLGAYLVAMILISYSVGQNLKASLSTFGTLVAVGAAFAVVGALVGFLFGMPKVFGKSTNPDNPASNNAMANPTSDNRSVSDSVETISHPDDGGWANNNLVEVSDWLTKIVVGVGLIQIQEIIAWTSGAGQVIGSAADLPSPMDEVVGVSVILLNSGLGFFVMYIYARTLLTIMFASVSDEVNSRLRRDFHSLEADSDTSIAELKERTELIERSLESQDIPIEVPPVSNSTQYSEEQKYERLKERLRSSEFTWRTLKRLAVETGIETEKEVGELLAKYGSGEVRMSYGNKGNKIAKLGI